MKRYWALLMKDTGNFYENGEGVPWLGGMEPNIPPMPPPGTERVLIEVRIVKYPDREKLRRAAAPKR